MHRPQTNDLIDFMLSLQKQMGDEYERISKRANKNGSHAGNEGELNWEKILSNWLPSDYHIVTKVKLMNEIGETSPEVDIAVLRPYYPKALLEKKLVLTAGVVAAFEVKNTLKAQHIKECFEKSVKIRGLIREPLPIYKSSLFKGYERELNSPIIYGILAHSHSWKGKKSMPLDIINDKIYECDLQYVTRPKEQLDIICVSDLALWSSLKRPLKMEVKVGVNDITWLPGPQTAYALLDADSHKKLSTSYAAQNFTPIGTMLCKLLDKLASTDKRLNDLSTYFKQVGLAPTQLFRWRQWPADCLSEEANHELSGIPNMIKGLLFLPF